MVQKSAQYIVGWTRIVRHTQSLDQAGGGTYVYHWDENRALTNRERARLQTFPDDFVFVGNKSSVRKQIGMAVPPQAAKVIVESMLKCFMSVSYPNVRPNMEVLR